MGELTQLGKLLRWLARAIEELPPGLLGRAWVLMTFEIGGGFLLGGVIVLLLIIAVTKFGIRIFGQFVKHDTFPVVFTTIVFVLTAVSAFATLATQKSLASLGVVSAAMMGIWPAHKTAVEIRDHARKKDLAADTPTEAPLPTDPRGSPG